MPSYGRIARSGLYWSYFRNTLAWLLLIPTTAVLARLLSPREFGIAAAAAFFVHLSVKLTKAGLNMALVRSKVLRPEHVSSVFVFYVVTSAAIWAILAVSSDWVGGFFRSTDVARVLPVAALSFVVQAFAAVPLALLRRDMRFRELAALQSLVIFVDCGVSVSLALAGFGYWSLIWSPIVSGTVQNVSAIYLTRWRPRFEFSPSAFGELVSFGSGTYASRLLEYVALNIDNLVIGRIFGITPLGYYDKAFSTMNRVITRINSAGPSVSFRIFSIIQEDPARFSRAYRKVVLTVTLVGYPVLGGLIAVAHPLFDVLLGRQWAPAVLPFQILCAGGMLKLTLEYASSATQAAGWAWAEAWRWVVYIVLIVAGILAFRSGGIVGASSAVFLATAAMWCLIVVMLRKATPLTWEDILRPQLPAVVCTAGIVAAVVITKILASTSSAASTPLILLGLQSAVGAAVYLGFLWFSRFHEVRALLHETLADFAPRAAGMFKLPDEKEKVLVG